MSMSSRSKWTIALAFCLSLVAFVFAQYSTSQVGRATRLEREMRDAGPGEREEREDEAANILGYAKWMQMYERGNNGIIDPKGKLNAIRQMQKLNSRDKMADQSAWVSAGPNNIPGRTLCVKPMPGNPQRILMATSGGGLFVSQDGGDSWTHNASLPDCVVSWIEFDPQTPSTVWLSTGEYFNNSSGITGIGLFKSKDGGLTWSSVNSTPFFGWVLSLAICPTDSTLMFVCTSNGIWRSSNSGVTFTNVDPGSAHNIIFCRNSNRMIASVHTPGSGYTAKYSDDFGKTWTAATGFTAVDPKRDNVGDRLSVVAQTTNGQSRIYCMRGSDAQYDQTAETWVSTDLGTSFTMVDTLDKAPSLNGYCISLTVDPQDPDHLVAGGNETWESLNGGRVWTKILPNFIHADIHYVNLFYDGDFLTLDVATDGGYYRGQRSFTFGWIFVSRNNDVTSTQFWSLSTGGNLMEGGTQDNGTILVNTDDRSGIDYSGADGSGAAIDPTNNQIAYGSEQYGGIHRTMDAGASYQFIFQSIPNARNDKVQPFVPRLTLDPADHQKLFVGLHSLYRSDNPDTANPGDVLFKNIFNGSIDAKVMITSFGFGIKQGDNSSKKMYIGLSDGQIFALDDRTSDNPNISFVENNASLDNLPDRAVTAIYMDPKDATHIWVGLAGFEADNLWESTTGGATWKSLKGSYPNALPSAPILAINRDSAGNMMYLGTSVGLLLTTDYGRNFRRDNDHLVGVPVFGVEFFPGTDRLGVATHGRGMWYQRALETLWIEGDNTINENDITKMKVVLSGPTDVDRKVYLKSTSPKATVYPFVVVPAGKSEALFPITTKPVAAPEAFTLQARLGKEPISKSVTIGLRPDIDSLSAGPNPVAGGSSFVLHVGLSKPVIGSPYTIQVNSDNAAAPSKSVTIPVGASEANLLVFTKVTSTSQNVHYTCTTHAVTKSMTLVVQNPAVTKLSLSTLGLEGGAATPLVAQVKIANPAPAGGVVVQMASSDPAVKVGPNLTIPEGATTLNTTLIHYHQSADKNVKITASTDGGSSSANVLVKAATLQSLTLNRSIVTGGGRNGRLTGTLTLASPTGDRPFLVPVSSRNPNVTMPEMVSVPANSQSVKFTINSIAVPRNQTVTVNASTTRSTVSASFSLRAPQILSFTIDPTSVVGGSATAVHGYVTLTGAAPDGGIIFPITRNSSLVDPGTALNFKAGDTSAQFRIYHYKAKGEASARIRVDTVAAFLRVTP